MTSRSGWFAPRIERKHYRTALFAEWKHRAWSDLWYEADLQTGLVLKTAREMSLAWDTGLATVERWLGEMEKAGYIRLEKIGETARAGRRIIVLDIERLAGERNNVWNKGGTIGGTIKSSNGAGETGTCGTMFGTKAEQSMEHVERKKEVKETSSPSEKRDKQAGARTRKGTRRCPAEWQPDESCITLASTLGVDCGWQAGKMRDHTFATPRTDWDATFRNWLKEAAERGQARNGNGNGKHAAPERDAGEVQRAHQAQAEQAQEEFDRQREAWRVEVVSAWDRAPPLDKQRIRLLAEQGFEELRGNDVRFERAVRWRCLELLGDEIGKPKPTRKHA